MKYFFITIFICCTMIPAIQAQDTIIVHKDARIDILADKQAGINKVTARMNANGQFKGYRLQVLNTRNRDDAFKAKATVLENFPSEKVYVLYQSPYFKVRVGNFVTREEAENLKKQLSGYGSLSAYVIEDLIEYIPSVDEFQ